MRGQKEMRPCRQARERICTKQDQFTKQCVAAVVGFAAIYAFLTFGLGHLFGVI